MPQTRLMAKRLEQPEGNENGVEDQTERATENSGISVSNNIQPSVPRTTTAEVDEDSTLSLSSDSSSSISDDPSLSRDPWNRGFFPTRLIDGVTRLHGNLDPALRFWLAASSHVENSMESPAILLERQLINLKINPRLTSTFAHNLNKFCGYGALTYVNPHSMSGFLRLLVDKIFSDNNEQYNIFLTEAAICSTTTPEIYWTSSSSGYNCPWLFHLRQFFQVNGTPCVIHIFKQPVSVPTIEFSLDYMHAKFQRQQCLPLIVSRSNGRHESGPLHTVHSTSNENEMYSYANCYFFYACNPGNAIRLALAALAESD